jgi:FkbM family methyltransferase
VSGVLTKMLMDRATLTPGSYRSTLSNFELQLDRFEYVERCFALRGFFEWRIAAVASLVVRPGDVVFEGGAHIGTETHNYAALVGPTGRVVSYEADARLSARLRATLSRAGFTQCVVRGKALGAEPGHASFDAVAESSGNSGVGALSASGNPATADRVEVEVETLDQAMDEFGAPRLLVMDIQGGEIGALRGATRVLSEARPVIVLEVEAECLAPFGATPQDVFDILVAQGYTCWRLTRFGLSRIESPAADEWSDWVVVPRESIELVGRMRRTLLRGAVLPPSARLSPLSALRRS